MTNIALLSLEVSGGIPETYIPALTDRLRQELLLTGAFKVMEREQMNEILMEIGFQQTGCTSSECVVQAGRILGVKQMVAGTVGRMGEIHTISVRLIEVETSQVLKVESVDCVCPIEEVLTNKIHQVALKLAGIEKETQLFEKGVLGTGNVELSSTPSGAKVIMDNIETQWSTPTTLTNLSAGSHTIRLEKGELIGSKQIFVLPDVTSTVNINLRVGNCILAVESQPAGGEVFLDEKLLGKTPFRSDSVAAGIHNLKVTMEGYNPLSEQVQLKVNELMQKNFTLQRLSALKIVSEPSECKVYGDGKFLGMTPLELNGQVAGKYDFRLKHSGYDAKDISISLEPGAYISKDCKLIPKTRSRAVVYSAFIPGSGQVYADKAKGYFVLMWEVSATAAGIMLISDYNDQVSKYNQTRSDYQSAVYPDEIVSTRQKMDDAFDRLEEIELWRNVAISAAAAIYLYNIIDIAFISYFPGERSGPNFGFDYNDGERRFNLNLTFNLK